MTGRRFERSNGCFVSTRTTRQETHELTDGIVGVIRAEIFEASTDDCFGLGTWHPEGTISTLEYRAALGRSPHRNLTTYSSSSSSSSSGSSSGKQQKHAAQPYTFHPHEDITVLHEKLIVEGVPHEEACGTGRAILFSGTLRSPFFALCTNTVF